jgi:hypothetical protein
VNVLCDNALLTAYALGRKEIDTQIIKEVAEDHSTATNTEALFGPIVQVINRNGNDSAQLSGAGSVDARSEITRVETKFKDAPSTALVPVSFFNVLAAALTEAMGPMAKIVLRDGIKTLGESRDRFPRAKVDMLLESVGREILDEKMRAQFRIRMLKQ